MLLHVGGVRANLVGLLITIAISILVTLTSLYGPLATVGAWIFMILVPFDPSHAGINGMLSKLYDQNRHGISMHICVYFGVNVCLVECF